MWRVSVCVAALIWASVAAAGEARAQESAQRNVSSIQLAGRQVQCDRVRLRLDGRLNNLGAAAVDERLLLLNHRLLRRYSNTVQLFVFHHECGHHRIGASELRADCWAVNRGLRDGWLDRKGLGQVCVSFGNAPETPTHPSGRRRCANLDRCFATAELEIAREKQEQQRKIAADAIRNAPKLVVEPRLVRTSVLR
jgi:hypothetical protein